MRLSVREFVERWQIAVYLPAVGLGVVVGLAMPASREVAAVVVWPGVALLLFVTFLSLPLHALAAALRNRRYLVGLSLGNFVLLPLAVVAVLPWMPLEPAVRLAVALVLLAPCTDWFTTFSHLGGGDGRLALASTPLLLLGQMVAVPAWAWVMAGEAAWEIVRADEFLAAFAGVVLLPLVVALLLQLAGMRMRSVACANTVASRWPVPLLACVLLLVAMAEAAAVIAHGSEIALLAGVYVAYLVVAAVLGRVLGRMFRLGRPAANTLIFSFGTRNSFVIFPLVLAWTGSGSLAVVAVVAQSLVELVGMLVYMAWLRKPANDAPALPSRTCGELNEQF